MKSRQLFQKVMADYGRQCGVCTDRDWKTVLDRIKHEGDGFLTIALPAFRVDFERSLADGRVGSGSFAGYRRSRGLPAFLRGFLSLVFDPTDGTLLDDPSITAIWAVRGITGFFGKQWALTTPTRERRAINEFVECEKDLETLEGRLDGALLQEWRIAFSLLFGQAMRLTQEDLREGRIVSRHGPGATADRLRANQKWVPRQWTTRLERVAPCTDYLVPSHRYWDRVQALEILEPGEELPVKVTPVPKTAKAPRIIAIEPTCMQYMQQGIRIAMTRHLESESDVVGFSDQTPNQDMARRGSIDGSLATLDLSSASDRVPYRLVKHMFLDFPDLWDAMDACRSTRAALPDGTIVPLRKWASMGSALCFPIEAVVFATACALGIADALNVPVGSRRVSNAMRSVRVYGDDLIVPVDMTPFVVRRLESIGSKVNVRKSFWTGLFRESCGKEYFRGEDVTSVRFRKPLPARRQDADLVLSAVSLRNQLYEAGLWDSARWLDHYLKRLIPLPVVAHTSPVLGRVSFLGYETQRMSRTLHRPEVRGLVVAVRPPRSPLDDVWALQKFFAMRGEEPLSEEHLLRSGRSSSVTLNLRWAPSF